MSNPYHPDPISSVRSSLALPGTPASIVNRPGPGVEFKYACTLVVGEHPGTRATGEILVNPHYDFVIRRVSWDYATRSGIMPKVRVTWKDARRSYMDRPALLAAAFGNPGDDYPLVGPVRIDKGTTLSFDAVNAQEEASEIDIVIHGVELRRPGGE